MPSVISLNTLQSGSVSVFWNSAAPLGWVKETGIPNDSAVRVVNGTTSTITSNNTFSTVFDTNLNFVTSGTSFIASTQFPPHIHLIPTNTAFNGNQLGFDWNSNNAGTNVPTQASGSIDTSSSPYEEISGHLHSLSSAVWDSDPGGPGMPQFNLCYADVISCIKD